VYKTKRPAAKPAFLFKKIIDKITAGASLIAVKAFLKVRLITLL
jgi:hypothetical protein